MLLSFFRPQTNRLASPAPRSKREEGSGVEIGAEDEGNKPEAEVKVHPGASWRENEGSMLALLQSSLCWALKAQSASAVTPSSTTMGDPSAPIGGRLRDAFQVGEPGVNGWMTMPGPPRGNPACWGWKAMAAAVSYPCWFGNRQFDTNTQLPIPTGELNVTPALAVALPAAPTSVNVATNDTFRLPGEIDERDEPASPGGGTR